MDKQAHSVLRTVLPVSNKFTRSQRDHLVVLESNQWSSRYLVVKPFKPTECLSHLIQLNFKSKLSREHKMRNKNLRSSKNLRQRWKNIKKEREVMLVMDRDRHLHKAMQQEWQKTHHMQICKFNYLVAEQELSQANKSQKLKSNKVQRLMYCERTLIWVWMALSNQIALTQTLTIASHTTKVRSMAQIPIMMQRQSLLWFKDSRSASTMRLVSVERNPRAIKF